MPKKFLSRGKFFGMSLRGHRTIAYYHGVCKHDAFSLLTSLILVMLTVYCLLEFGQVIGLYYVGLVYAVCKVEIIR